MKKKPTIGITAPSSPFKKDIFKKNTEFLTAGGYIVKYSENIFLKNCYVAGSIEERLSDLISVIQNPDIDIIIFARGGYGSMQLLPRLYELRESIRYEIQKKDLIGFSDITALFSFFQKEYNKSCFYGPNIVSSELRETWFTDFLKGTKDKIIINGFDILRKNSIKEKLSGVVKGGCISLIGSLCGTPYADNYDNCFLFLEDSNEVPYRIDRMIQQLYLAGTLDKIKGIMMGSMKNCEQDRYSWKHPILAMAEKLDIDVISGINAGHAGFSTVIPLNYKAEINYTDKRITFTKPITKKKSGENIS